MKAARILVSSIDQTVIPLFHHILSKISNDDRTGTKDKIVTETKGNSHNMENRKNKERQNKDANTGRLPVPRRPSWFG